MRENNIYEKPLVLNNLHKLSKEQILALVPDNQLDIWPSNETFNDCFDGKLKIDLGIHKHDLQTMIAITSNFGKYYFVNYLSVENFILPESLIYCFRERLWCPSGTLDTFLNAIRRFGYTYGEEVFYRIFNSALHTPRTKPESFADEFDYQFHDFDEMFKSVFEDHEEFGSMLDKAKAVLLDPANRHLLPHFTEEFDNL